MRSVWDSVTLGLSTEGGRLVLRRRLADYPARPTPSAVRSCEKDERRRWLGTVGAKGLRVPSSFVGHLLVLVMQQFLESRSFPGMVVQASLRCYTVPVAYARGHCDRRKALEYGHGVISSVRSNVCLSSLVQAIAYHVVHPFGALGALYSVLCWSFSFRCRTHY